MQYSDGFHDLEYAKPVTIKKGCWIASNVTICGGVTIGENTIVGAGSVVTRDLPSDCIAVGSPAKVLRYLDENDKMDVWNTYVNDDLPLSIRDKQRLDEQNNRFSVD